ncbi:enoyl-CoA hydratase-related protein [Aeromicrobium sp. IC_218]|uniref:enoyl-CoA hydratase/isomerase family protein n=1 Tax=Aeromicrobium sp. IC_218 TaxID=2545468 RepID=UPI00103C4508|nr:enoyl-CoA hydratase-related protein [Aeromicrobium sp. IC_218]TCI96393.1 enoyl-CoA hydratase/isomerase family protein [Aeromicrobium sp. IC_218]
MSADASLLVRTAGAVTTLTINRPQAYNALDADVLAGLRAAVLAAADDPAVRVVVIDAAGEKAFSAGADLKELSGMGPDEAHATMRAGQQALRDIERAPVPVVAAVQGLALGGGFELALSATFPVLSTRASLGLPETSLGLIPGYGGTQRLPRAVGPRVAAHLMLTGSRLEADRAYALGLTPVPPVAPGELATTVAKIAAAIARQGPDAVRSVLTALESGRDAALDAGLHLETGLAALAVASAESDEGITAFLERRPARFAEPATKEQA